jgi:hypothetical protein
VLDRARFVVGDTACEKARRCRRAVPPGLAPRDQAGRLLNGHDPEGYVLYTYAAIQCWADAAAKIDSLDPKRIAEALKAQGPWQIVLGPIGFDRKGDVTVRDYVFYVWKNGAYSEIWVAISRAGRGWPDRPGAHPRRSPRSFPDRRAPRNIVAGCLGLKPGASSVPLGGCGA